MRRTHLRFVPLAAVMLAVAALLVLPAAASAQSVIYNVVPASDESATTRTVLTGSQIQYYLYATVEPDEPGVNDNSGLAAIIINIDTDLDIEQPPVSMLSETIQDDFLFPSSGTPFEDDLLEIGGAQASFAGDPVTGLGQDVPFLVATGFFQTPNIQGTFHVRVAEDSTANVFTVDIEAPANIVPADVFVGEGFSIITDDNAQVDPGPDGDPNDGGSGDPNDGGGTDPNDGGGSDPNDGGGTIIPSGTPLAAFAALGVVLAMLGIGFALFGPWGVVGALFLGSIVGLIILAGG